jgi:ferredoxin, 2Fe-2S
LKTPKSIAHFSSSKANYFLANLCGKSLFLLIANSTVGLQAQNRMIMYTITYKFEQKGLEPITLTGIEEGQSLLEVALSNDIDLHHNCGGVCACSTCHLYVEQGEQHIEELSDREEDFIDRAINPRLNSRLGCQCVLQPGAGEIVVTLPDQTQFLGE